MGKNKPNGYSLFVKEEFKRRERSGNVTSMQELFAELGPKWRELPDEMKQRYKDRASNYYNGPPPPYESQNRDSTRPAQDQALSTRPPSAAASQEATPDEAPLAGPSNPNTYFKQDIETKVKLEPGTHKQETELKPIIKQERGEKRSHWALEVYQTQEERQQSQDDPFGERPNKKAKKPPGYGIPNWKNIKNSTQPDADRYFDYDLVERRNTCRSIVETRADRIVSMPFYTISCNVLCKYKNASKEWKYIPIEIGLYCYSMEKGSLGEPYTVLINAGKPPNNYFNDSRDHAMKTHKIGFTRGGDYPREAKNNYRTIYKEMCKYTKSGERTVLVADHRDIEQVRMSIEWLYEQASEMDKTLPRPTTWTILPLVDFVTEAYNFVYMKMLKNPQPKFTLPYYLKMRLESSLWDYEVEYMCSFHKQDSNQTKWCALNCAIRVVKCLETIFDEIYNNFKLAMEPPEEAPQPQPQASDSQEVSERPDESSVAKTTQPTSFVSKSRPAIQQTLQPLYRCSI